MDFVAIDFETASSNPNSACQLGAVQVRGGEITQEYSWLIRPPRMYFSPRNIAIHGIRPTQVAHSPPMSQLWESLHPLLDEQVVIAHNARFDINVLVQSLSAFDIACPRLQFSCTRTLARAAWPGRARYGLKPLGASLGIRFNHHDALEDARCCARIAVSIADHCQARSLAEVEEKLQVKRGNYRDGRITSPLAIGRKHLGRANQNSTDKWGFPGTQIRQAGGVDAHTVIRAAADSRPLLGKKILMLGPLRGLSMDDTRNLIVDLGGVCLTNLTEDTDFVVACGTTLETAREQLGRLLPCQSNSVKSPESDSTTQTEPSLIGFRLLSERQFRALLPAGKSSTW